MAIINTGKTRRAEKKTNRVSSGVRWNSELNKHELTASFHFDGGGVSVRLSDVEALLLIRSWRKSAKAMGVLNEFLRSLSKESNTP